VATINKCQCFPQWYTTLMPHPYHAAVIGYPNNGQKTTAKEQRSVALFAALTFAGGALAVPILNLPSAICTRYALHFVF
ncbi:MAG: hypothetical protein KDE31_30245, partial [Caldilineaceae bacterium]|nr:hypothetical protein [Caldilineaceae bacterium]